MRIKFGGHDIELDPCGGLFIPAHKYFVVTDLHLEKGSSYAQSGYFLPPYDSHDTLTRLEEVLQKYECNTLILLGDTVHDPHSFKRLPKDLYTRFERLCRDYDVIWIEGNHEAGFTPENVRSMFSYESNGLSFQHILNPENPYPEMSGHYHPKATLKHKGVRLSSPCFVMNDSHMILPSFGSYTGGLDVLHPEINRYFGCSFDLYMCGTEKVVHIPSKKLFNTQ